MPMARKTRKTKRYYSAALALITLATLQVRKRQAADLTRIRIAAFAHIIVS